MRRTLVLAAAAVMSLALASCGGPSGGTRTSGASETAGDVEESSGRSKNVELTLWTYPIGSWGNSGTISSLLGAFHREYPDIRVSVKELTYETGDAQVEEAISSGKTPDLILEGPERLVANWGSRGLMDDISDLWEEEPSEEIYDSVRMACHDLDGKYYIYPLCMTTHCMAVNRDLFEKAGAWQYIDEETHTWSTDDFIAAVAALKDYGIEEAAAVYCGGQAGDQGTRALVNNLYSGTFTNPEHTRYTADSPENIRALELLREMDGVSFAPDLLGSQELEMFCKGELAMSFCWNVSMEIRKIVENPGLDFDIFPMTFPTDDGDFNLQGGIWGFGIFDNGDEERLSASRTFIRFMCGDDTQYTRSVLASTYWPVRDVPDIYVNDQLMNEYGIFQQYMGDYYQVTPGWAEARTAWWNMLQRVGEGEDVAQAVKEFADLANAAAGSE